jgi:hypothetical protein
VTTADIVMERALTHARDGTEDEAALGDLLGCCGGNRVAVVLARQHLVERTIEGQDEHASRAAELLEQTLQRFPEE